MKQEKRYMSRVFIYGEEKKILDVLFSFFMYGYISIDFNEVKAG